MQPNQPYAPPPAQTTPEQNPYDFIMNSGDAPKKGPLGLPGGSSTMQRMLIVGGGLVILLIVGTLLMSVLAGGGKSNSAQLLTLAQTQTELVRVSENIAKEPKLANENTRILALNTSLSVGSTKQQVLGMITKSGKKVKDKELGISKNSKTDSALAAALQNNQYDEVAVKILNTELKSYRLQLKTSYGAVSSNADKQVLSDAFKGAGLLLGANADTAAQ